MKYVINSLKSIKFKQTGPKNLVSQDLLVDEGFGVRCYSVNDALTASKDSATLLFVR